MSLDTIDRQIIQATQSGLPLVAEPYQAVAERLGLTAQEVMQRMAQMQQTGVIRRIAAVPNHYKLGYRYNGMTVWDIDDSQIDVLGPKVAELVFVSH
ncbi:MAG: protein nirH, partial [Methylomonas sp.]